MTYEICILAGGLSRRMGRDKSRLRLGDLTMLGQIRGAARKTEFPVRVIRRDAVPRCGPIGGIHTALKSTRAQAVLFLACDMPFVTPGLVEWVLAEYGKAARANSARQGLFVRSRGVVGFPFVLEQKVLADVTKEIEQGCFSLHGLARALEAAVISVPRAFSAQLRNINTPGEWIKARRRWRG